MDINLLRSLTTIFSLAVFIAIVVWTYKRANKDAFSEAAQLPFAEGESGPAAQEGVKNHE